MIGTATARSWERRDVSIDFTIEVVDAGEVHTAVVAGQLDLANADRVREVVSCAGGRTVVVDLSRLEFCDSSGIAALLAARSRVTEDGRSFEIRGATGIVRQVFEVTGLSSLLTE